jgi:tetratricopeptide (TPR) repeat protein
MARNIFFLLVVFALIAILGLGACEWVKIPGSPKCQKEDGEPVQQIGELAEDANCVETDTGLVEYKGPFRHRWWHYYNRAQCFLQKGCLQGAIDDLKIAISQRSKDQWNARTYGMHFMDYFPNRELGIAYYYQGKKAASEEEYKKAVEKLEESLSYTPSAKAVYYLEKVYGLLTASGEV